MIERIENILVCDDDELFRRRTSDLLQRYGYFVLEASSGLDAKDKLIRNKIDLAIIDIILPDYDGAELAIEVREKYPDVAIVVITQRNEATLAVNLLKKGIDEYIVKPIGDEELLNVIELIYKKRVENEEKSKLLVNSSNYNLQLIYDRIIRLLTFIELDKLYEAIVETLVSVLRVQGAILWVPDKKDKSFFRIESYRGLVQTESFPFTFSLKEHPLQSLFYTSKYIEDSELSNGEGAVIGEIIDKKRNLILPLVYYKELYGVVKLVEKISGEFTESDIRIASLIAEFSAIAIRNCKYFEFASYSLLREKDSHLYSMAYFIDYAGKEIYRARRYKRPFSVVEIVIDNAEYFKLNMNKDMYENLSKWLVGNISTGLRSSDVISRVSESEFLLVMPDTDYMGALAYISRSLNNFRSEQFVNFLDKYVPLSVSMGAASFPAHGSDYDSLIYTCSGKIKSIRESVYRRHHLEDMGFYQIIDYLVGSYEDYVSYFSENKDKTSIMFLSLEQSSDQNAHMFLSHKELDYHIGEVTNFVRSITNDGIWLLFIGRSPSAVSSLLSGLVGYKNPNAKMFVVSIMDKEGFKFKNISLVSQSTDLWQKYTVFLVLSAAGSYGMMFKNEFDRYYGFSTNDEYLIFELITKFVSSNGLHLKEMSS
ncbi:MAG: response regulator [Deltaproteobacteria bacterium]|nr:response regulator [Deltaproteobacteria bacterium]